MYVPDNYRIWIGYVPCMHLVLIRYLQDKYIACTWYYLQHTWYLLTFLVCASYIVYISDTLRVFTRYSVQLVLVDYVQAMYFVLYVTDTYLVCTGTYPVSTKHILGCVMCYL